MRVPRKNFELNDMIEVFDDYYRKALAMDNTRTVETAWSLVPSNELAIIEKEIERCALDRRYYLENYHCIRTEAGAVRTLYPFWEHQEIVYEALEREYKRTGQALLIVLKPRQAGLTTWSGGIVFHCTIFIPHAFTLSMAQDSRVSLEIYNRLLYAYNNLPWWMRPEFASKQQGFQVVFQRSDEERIGTDPGLGSTLLISDAQKGTGIAIGRTVRFLHASEVSRWPDAEVFTADIEPSMNAPDQIGIMESTAYGRKGLFFNMWKGSVEGETGWVPVFIPVYQVRKYSLPILKGERIILTKEEEELRKKVREDEKFDIPLGFFKWRHLRVKQTKVKTGRESSHHESYPITPSKAFISSGYCAFPEFKLDEQELMWVRDPILVGEIQYLSLTLAPVLDLHPPDPDKKELKKPDRMNRLWVWEEPDPDLSVEYQIAVDASSGDGLDYSDVFVLRAGRGMEPHTQVAEWHGLINPVQLAGVAAALGVWYHMAEIAVEYQQSGITTGNELLHQIEYPSLYRWKHLDKVSNTNSTFVHWITSTKTRPALFDRASAALLEDSVIIRNIHLLEECRDCGREEGATKIEGIDNNDDQVMAWMICLYTLMERHRMEYAGSTDSLAHRLSPREPVLVGVYDKFMRQLTQCESEQEADAYIKKYEDHFKAKAGSLGLTKHKILVMKANTPYSPIWDSQGAENELYKLGVDPKKMTPDLVAIYRDMLTRRHYEGDEY